MVAYTEEPKGISSLKLHTAECLLSDENPAPSYGDELHFIKQLKHSLDETKTSHGLIMCIVNPSSDPSTRRSCSSRCIRLQQMCTFDALPCDEALFVEQIGTRVSQESPKMG